MSIANPHKWESTSYHKHVHRQMPSHAHQNRHEAFILFNECSMQFECLICDTIIGNYQSVPSHCNRPDHETRLQGILKMRESNFVQQCCLLQRRMDNFPLIEAWQIQLQCHLYWILLCRCEPDSNLSMVTANMLLDQLEHMERASLLELAAWKAVCVASTLENHDIHAMQEWVRHGWKAKKSEMRSANEIHVIVTAVLPFVSSVIIKPDSPSQTTFYRNLFWPKYHKRSYSVAMCQGLDTALPYACNLCGVSIANEDQFRTHLASIQHIKRLPRFFSDSVGYPYNEKCFELQLRIDELGLLAWKKSIQCILYWILLYQGEPKDHLTMARATELLMKYEQMERISLLELAAWKVICIASADNMQDIYTVQDWVCKGWKARKNELRRDAGIHVIVSEVLPFLAE